MKISRLSTQFVTIRVQGTSLDTGDAIDPTGDAAALAFIPSPGPNPEDDDWIAATWGFAVGDYWTLGVLVGPGVGGKITLNAGPYDLWAKFTDAPEQPVIHVGRLDVY